MPFLVGSCRFSLVLRLGFFDFLNLFFPMKKNRRRFFDEFCMNKTNALVFEARCE